MEPNATTVYYFFSTVAQTVAAIVAILAAFAVVRLSELATRLRDQLSSLAHYSLHPEIFYADLTEGDFAGAIRQIPEDPLGGSDDHLVIMVCARMESERKVIISTLRFSSVTAGLVIILSVTILIFAEAIAANGSMIWAVLILGLIGLALCLVVAGRLIAKFAPGRLQKIRTPRKITKKGSGPGTPHSG